MTSAATWSDPRLAAQVLRERRDGLSEIALHVDALDDARQVLWLEQRIHGLAGVRRVSVDRTARRMRVVWDTRRTSLPTLLQQFAAAGSPARPLRRDETRDARAAEMHDALKRILVAGMCAM